MSTDPRERLRADLEVQYDELIEMLRAAGMSTKKKRIDEPCTAKGCGCKHIRMIDVPDFDMKMKVAEFMMNQGFGRPAQAESERDDEKIVFKRLTDLSDLSEQEVADDVRPDLPS